MRRLNRHGVERRARSAGGVAARSRQAGREREQARAIGVGLLEAVRAAEAAGVDAEGALRLATAEVERAADA